jgi:predicted nucleotide-binding protein (sugar kinase/HSP70/actin superfamily)
VVVVRRTAARIGVPRSILHYEFGGATERFLRRLGVDVVLSPPTNREIFRAGKRVVIDELCFPIKIFVGHVAHLAALNVDRIVVPVVVGHVNDRVFPCHPRSRSADIVRALGVCDETRLLSPAFRFDADGPCAEGFHELARSLGFSEEESHRALPKLQTRDSGPGVRSAPHPGPTVGIVGRPYVVKDAWANNHVAQRLESLGCRVLTEDDVQPIGYSPEGTGLHFALAARTLTLARRWDRAPEVDGIVFLLPFNCGPDGDIARHLQRTVDTPILTLVLDELQSSAGMVTRLEAFVDLLTPAREPVGGRST